MHSFNLGLVEAVDLATQIEQTLKGTASVEALDSYNERCRQRWQFILKPVWATPDADEWIEAHCQRIVSYLPASGPELTFLLGQLGIGMDAADADPVPV